MQIAKKKLDKKPNMDCVNLVTTILACYPQISTLSVDANETIHLHYILNKVLTNKKIDELKKTLFESLQTYQYLQKFTADINDITISSKENFTFIDITRDICSFSYSELNLLNNLLLEYLTDLLIIDADKNTIDELNFEQIMLIDNLLGSLKVSSIEETITGIREQGRVVVFNEEE